MSVQKLNPAPTVDEAMTGRPIAAGTTEHGWCKAVPGGTGQTILALLSSRPPQMPSLQASIDKIQLSHPILRSKIHFNPQTSKFSFLTNPKPSTTIKSTPLPTTTLILEKQQQQTDMVSHFQTIKKQQQQTDPVYHSQTIKNQQQQQQQQQQTDMVSHFQTTVEKQQQQQQQTDLVSHFQTTVEKQQQQQQQTDQVSNFQTIIEHEMSIDAWANNGNYKTTFTHDVFFATVYELPGAEWMMVLRLHVLACDRTAAVALLRELLVLFRGGEVEKESGNKGEVSLGIENLVPAGKARKALLARGLDVLGYSMGSLTLTNLKFKDSRSPRRSEMVRFKLDLSETQKLVSGCDKIGIKLCGVLVAAGLIAAHNSNKSKKYGVVTMVDCRSLLDPPLSSHHFGFYHSAILNTHAVRGGERLWELAARCYKSFSDDKNNQKHFTDMADLNFLMGKAVDNPSLTPSGSLRTSLLCIFEDTVVDDSEENRREAFGLEDYVGCASIHGVGPSISMFHVVQDGRLDLVCVYPAPLHSRDQVRDLVDKMRTVLVAAGDGGN